MFPCVAMRCLRGPPIWYTYAVMSDSPAERTIKAVFFDLDETLIRHRRGIDEITEAVFAEFAEALEPITREKFWRTFWGKAQDMWRMTGDGVIDGAVARRYTYINTLTALGADVSLADKMVDRADQVLAEATEFEHETRETLEQLRKRGYRLGIVTNGYFATQQRKIDLHAIGELVDSIVVSAEAGAHKPHPKVFERALASLGVEASESLFVGDMPENDIRGAMDVGMQSALVEVNGTHDAFRDGQTCPEPTYRITHPSELLDILGTPAQ